MIEKKCNLWLERADYYCVPSSGATGPDGSALLEGRVAKEAAQRFSGFEIGLGRLITSRGNHVHLVRPGVVSFPVQQYQWSGPNLQIIERSARQLVALVGTANTLLPRPGCEPGQLAWEDVQKLLAGIL